MRGVAGPPYGRCDGGRPGDVGGTDPAARRAPARDRLGRARPPVQAAADGLPRPGAGRRRQRARRPRLRLGEKLHIGVVVAEPTVPLNPGRNYSYDVGFQPQPSVPDAAVLQPTEVTPSETLGTLGLLADGTVNGRPHKALGYAPNDLPGFALPPTELKDLRILHGSCRRPGFIYDGTDGKTSYDGLAFVDDLIDEWRPRRAERQHAPAPAVPDRRPDLRRRRRPADAAAAQPARPHADRPRREAPAHLAAGGPRREQGGLPRRAQATRVRDDPRVRGGQAPDALKRLKRDRARARAGGPVLRAQVRPALPAAVRRRRERHGLAAALGRDAGEVPAGPARAGAELRGEVLLLRRPQPPDDGRRVLRALSRRVVQPGLGARRRQADLPDARADLQRARAAARSCGTSTAASRASSYSRATDRARCSSDLAKHERKGGGPEKRVNTLTTFYDSLPRVRRALANVPTYMIFDDHDVTDDWNISRSWRDQVYTSLLGRRIVTGALAAYALFQDWGNDPLGYRLNPHKRVLQQAREAVRAGRDRRAVRRAREALRPQPVRPRARPGHRGQLALARSTAPSTAWSGSTRARGACTARATAPPGCSPRGR